MPSPRLLIVVALASGSIACKADELLYSYEGDVVPYDESAGWEVFNPCEDPCFESVENGHFALHWPQAGDLVNYSYLIAPPGEPPPPTLWLEWRFRSNHPLGPIYYGCDARFYVHYQAMADGVNLYGDAAIAFSGSYAVLDLDINKFHTFRYESLDGVNYRIAVDGLVFMDDVGYNPPYSTYLQFGGRGGCASDQIPNAVNEWDFVRYGTLSESEQVVATDPPEGYLDPELYPELDRFSVTFDAPSFAFTDDIVVQVSGGEAPQVQWVWRLDNHGPETFEVILDRPIPMGEATTFTFNPARNGQTVSYTYILQPSIPAVSTWGMTAMTLLILLAGTVVFRGRKGDILGKKGDILLFPLRASLERRELRRGKKVECPLFHP